MATKFTLLVDESGDQGLDKVMTKTNSFGASPYLTMGAALVPNSLLSKFSDQLEIIREKLGTKSLHCTEMQHLQVAFLAREISKLRILCFGVISKKSTLGTYKDMIAGEDQAHDYYKKCAHYLLELVASYAGEKDISANEIDIIFEEKRGHDYGRLERYLETIARRPIDARAAKINYLKPFRITAKTKAKEPLLAIPDCLAYSLLRGFCSENNRLHLTEQRYLRELKHKFHHCSHTEQIANHGIKFIKGPVKMGLTGSDYKFAQKFYKKLK